MESLATTMISPIWKWIFLFNSIYVDIHRVEDLITIRNNMIRNDRVGFDIICSAVIWSMWLDRNRICFKNGPALTLRRLEADISALVTYWTGNMPTDVSLATRGTTTSIECHLRLN